MTTSKKRCDEVIFIVESKWILLVIVFLVLIQFSSSDARFVTHHSAPTVASVRHVGTTQRSISKPLARFRKNRDLHNEPIDSTDGQNNDARRTAKLKINQALRHAGGSPKLLLGTVATGGIFHFLRSNGEATRRAVYFWTRAGPMVIHYRFTQWWLGASHANRAKRDVVYGSLHDRYCHPCLDIILHLKGLYVKIGQVLSARPDFVPRQYVQLFATVQDAIPQWPIEEVEDIIQRELHTEYGLTMGDVFESIDPVALGSASIGQVHKAVLRSPWDKSDGRYNCGKIVAVKVMHPGAKDRFRHDFSVFKWLCRVALPGWKPVLQELERQIMTEFDYRNEAASLEQVRSNMAQTRYADKICIPQPLLGLCSTNLLVMQMLEGKKLSDAIEDRLTVALGGDRKLVHDFMQKKQEGSCGAPFCIRCLCYNDFSHYLLRIRNVS